MKKVLILGGGLAGLSAASYLANKNIQVTLIEASPKLGGRASSFFYKPENMLIDNGQHILMSCYKYALDFINLIGSADHLEISKNLEIPFIDEEGKTHLLSAKGSLYPLNLLKAVSNFSLLTKKERRSLITFLIKLKFVNPESHRTRNAADWLQKSGQSENAVEKFWNLIIASVFNSSPNAISAESFIEVMKIVFLSGKGSSNIILPKKSLAELFSIPAKKFIEEKAGIVKLGERAVKIVTENNRITEILTNKNNYSNFDFVISALPFEKLRKILPEKLQLYPDFTFEYSPIVSAHLFLEKNSLKSKYSALIKSPIDWIFNKNNVISIVKSASFEFEKMSKNEIKKVIIDEIKAKVSDFDEKMIKNSIILKERKATFVISNKTEEFRRNFKLNIENFAVAGDWTNTKLPSTMESAVKSGFFASEKVKNLL